MHKNIIKKGLTISVILLFVAVSFQPVIANEPTEKTTVDDEKIEYTIQIIKTNKIIENKVYLTLQQADELENLIEYIRADLNNSETQEETKEIYNNAINSFNRMGLFPENITMDEIKQLVYGETQNLDSIRFIDKTFTGFDNKLCLVSGESSNTIFLAPVLLLLTATVYFTESYLLKLLDNLDNNFFLLKYACLLLLSLLIAVPFTILYLTSLGSIFSVFPITIGGIGCLGYGFELGYEMHYYPASGWITTMGLNGKKNYTGEFFGNLGETYLVYPGILGFTGLHILRTTGKVFYFGSALKVDISTEPFCDVLQQN